MPRSAVLIDGAYLGKFLQTIGEPRVAMDILANKVARDDEIIRTYYYTCMPYQGQPPTPEERTRYARMDSFVYNLRKLPRFEVSLGK